MVTFGVRVAQVGDTRTIRQPRCPRESHLCVFVTPQGNILRPCGSHLSERVGFFAQPR
jgi:hypothetical protein